MKRVCPICRMPTESETHADFPFCSERCRLLDLGAWASGKYVISQTAFDESEFEGADRKASQSDAEDEERGRER